MHCERCGAQASLIYDEHPVDPPQVVCGKCYLALASDQPEPERECDCPGCKADIGCYRVRKA